MKRWMIATIALVSAMSMTACGNGGGQATDGKVTLTVGATAVPHAEILNFVKPALEKQGVALEITEFTDYVQPNVQVFEKQLDANFFQHLPYLEQFNADNDMDLVSVGGVHIEPFGAYSEKAKSADDLRDGAIVAIPNDPTNAGRALALLAANGLLTLKDGVGVAATTGDIVDNPKRLEIKELEAAMLPRVLADVNLALINTNYALEAGFVPTKDALFLEDGDSPYVNVVVARPDNQNAEAIRKLMEAVGSEEVKHFIEEKYQGAIVPAN
ncbi:MetQ/NlpA family ABC transporter substrate-binding protein [Paenibacillus sp. TRM 82003]|nr:MetQ/NlpA family ABC transporter substrate-binding protein [Paenibacillus sp. TRM 82003]